MLDIKLNKLNEEITIFEERYANIFTSLFTYTLSLIALTNVIFDKP